jgi:hypothetical protein
MGGKTLGPSHFRGKKTGGGEGKVAHDLGLDAEAVLPGEKLVLRIAVEQLGTVTGALAIGLGQDDPADERLARPAFRDEFRGEPIEQLGMSGTITPHPEILGRGHEPLAEQLRPEVVRDDARRQRIFTTHQPTGEIEAVTRRGAVPHRR